MGYYCEGLFALMLGDYKEAEKQLTLAIENNEKVAQSHYIRAKTQARLRNIEGCLDDINTSIKINPDNALP